MFFKEKIIKNYIEYDFSQNVRNNKIINIGYGIDNNYARCMATSIASFCINNKDKNIIVHVIASDLLYKTKVKLKKLAQDYKIDIIIYEIDIKYFNNLPTISVLSIAAYFRILFPMILKNVSTLFYIDADIICLKNVKEFFDINLNDNIIGAVPDLKKLGDERNKILELENHIYFNSGVLIINIEKWRELNLSEKIIDVINKNKDKIKYEDQDALNIVLKNKVKYIDKKYNCMDIESIDINKIGLLHFAAHPKPWQIAFPISKICNSFNKNLYLYYEKQTPWENTALEKPRNYKEIGTYVKALYYNHDYIKALYMFIKYLYIRIIENKK